MNGSYWRHLNYKSDRKEDLWALRNWKRKKWKKKKGGAWPEIHSENMQIGNSYVLLFLNVAQHGPSKCTAEMQFHMLLSVFLLNFNQTFYSATDQNYPSDRFWSSFCRKNGLCLKGKVPFIASLAFQILVTVVMDMICSRSKVVCIRERKKVKKKIWITIYKKHGCYL